MTYIRTKSRTTKPKFLVGQKVSIRFTSEHGTITSYSVEKFGHVSYGVRVDQTNYVRWYSEKDLVLRV